MKLHDRKAKSVCSFFLTLALLLCSFTGCGKSENTQGSQAQTGYSDILSDSRTLFQNDQKGDGGFSLGIQFWDGEPLQLWYNALPAGDGEPSFEVRLYHADGSTELLLEKVSIRYRGSWYLDREGNYYVMTGSEFVKLSTEGEPLWHCNAGVLDFCELDDGRIFALLLQNGSYRLARLNPQTGELTLLENPLQETAAPCITADGSRLLLLSSGGVCELNTADGKKTPILEFTGTSYSLSSASPVADFRLSGEKEVSILYMNGVREDLLLEDVDNDKTVITLRLSEYSNDPINKWLRRQVTRFNKQSDEYCVVLDTLPNDEAKHDFIQQTGILLGTGKGPDLMDAGCLADRYSLIKNGFLEDLAPRLEQSGIRQEDYYPVAFDAWRVEDGIYGINLGINISVTYSADAALLGRSDTPSREELLNILLAAEEPMCLAPWLKTAKNVLHTFLHTSEDFCGALDWENGTCDFHGELFGKLLAVAKKYNYGDKTPEKSLLSYRRDSLLYYYEDLSQLEAQGRVPIGEYFDDGDHPYAETGLCPLLAMNASSQNKEGAWAFLAFLMGEDAQGDIEFLDGIMPIRRDTYRALAEREIEIGPIEKLDHGVLYKGEAVTEERMLEYEKVLEDARYAPLKTDTILDIVLEEADYYFNGDKDLEETLRVIENRVGLYMSEQS